MSIGPTPYSRYATKDFRDPSGFGSSSRLGYFLQNGSKGGWRFKVLEIGRQIICLLIHSFVCSSFNREARVISKLDAKSI
ncbi:hypothetical protein EYC80_007191 [Monilinia laxa]|uniref:Uncharacterized protein n=1 Tax=Monilinia laxa TaxID=61186 RepID=A0A5N6K0G4_MONLA|nr:hypothetical protein EYC80_007191 [Monilinia laxa]